LLVAGFPAGSFGTNCYVVAPAAGEQCVVIDPGQDAYDGVEEILTEHRLTPVAVLLTHGHIDHVWSVVPVCDAHDVPAYIHPEDRFMLADPGRSFGRPGESMFGGVTFAEPTDVIELADEQTISLAGLDFVVNTTPGHTPGSITFALPEAVFFSGDLIFAGSVGRTDFPGGSYDELMESIVRVVLPLDDELPILSGHGPATTVGQERATNPFVAEAIARGRGETPSPLWTPSAGPARGL
jgi:glyoxylase-like metal-dependent hydrolase (beta-lactamase superfamily II)